MMIYTYNIISHWLVVIAAVTAAASLGYLLNLLIKKISSNRL